MPKIQTWARRWLRIWNKSYEMCKWVSVCKTYANMPMLLISNRSHLLPQQALEKEKEISANKVIYALVCQPAGACDTCRQLDVAVNSLMVLYTLSKVHFSTSQRKHHHCPMAFVDSFLHNWQYTEEHLQSILRWVCRMYRSLHFG